MIYANIWVKCNVDVGRWTLGSKALKGLYIKFAQMIGVFGHKDVYQY
jgi:hypothetical protein